MRTQTKRTLLWGVLALLVLGGLAAASPYLAVHAMRQAAQDNDTDKLAQHVDFPALRQSLKDNFNARLTEELRKDPKNPLAPFGVMFGASLVNQLVDAFTTPDNLARLVRGGVPQELGSASFLPLAPEFSPKASAAHDMATPSVGQQAGQQTRPQAGNPVGQQAGQSAGQSVGQSVGQPAGQVVAAQKSAAPPTVSMGYETISRFVVRVADKKPGAQPLTLEFRRTGLFSWRLCAVHLPQ